MTTSTWTAERVEQLRSFVTDGLTCSQIAAEIGVSRNAVIGKIHRLGLSPMRSAGDPARRRPPRARRPRFTSQRQILRLLYAPTPCLDETRAVQGAAIGSAQPCSLVELAQGKCRWPLNDSASGPQRADFAFCGNDSITGFSYCAGHARMAYRSPAQRRA